MVRTKKRLPVAAQNTEAKGISIGDNPPIPKKRGRPRKVVQETVKVEEFNNTEDNEQKTSEDAVSNRSNQKQTESSEAGSDKNVAADKASYGEEPPRPKVVKREGNRRKSEPRRAAESYVPGR